MFTFIAENKYGDQLELTHNPAYAISNISGFDPPDATINATKNAGFDGTVYNSATMDARTVTITLAVNGPAESNRLQLYRFFRSKDWVRLYYKTDTRDVYTDGYVQSFNVGFFDKKETVQITVYCPRAYLQQAGYVPNQVIDMSGPLFEFEFAIEEPGIPFSEAVTMQTIDVINGGDLEAGVTVDIYITGAVTNPKIYNETTGDIMILNDSFQADDEITICTIPGEKKITRLRSGTESSLVGKLSANSTWLKLAPGYNSVTVTADSGGENMVMVFDLINLFEGV